MKCETCCWFVRGRNERPLYDGACVRYPPQVVGDVPVTMFPDVNLGDYCGEFKPSMQYEDRRT